MTHKVYPFLICIFFFFGHLFAIGSALKQVVAPTQSSPECRTPPARTPPHPDRVGHDRQHIPGELDSHLKQQSLSLPSCRPRVLSFASADCITRLPSGLLGTDPLITRSAHTHPLHRQIAHTYAQTYAGMRTCSVAKEAPWSRACTGLVAWVGILWLV